MATMRLEIVTPERTVLDEQVDEVLARGIEGDLGVLPNHMPLMTPLGIGELQYKQDGDWHQLAVIHGFMQVRPDAVIVLADEAERSEEIDRERAEEARRRAEQALSEASAGEAVAEAHMQLQRALTQLRVAGRRHGPRRRPVTEGPDAG